ncbi:MAG TPA: hypothetical protein VFJ82_14550 [Longimicrobium sp.]|nr:hypothetical protein [Longimicrobium sp.]
MDLMTFLLDRTVARNEGVTDEAAANRIALLGSVIAQQNMVLSLILVQKLARDEVAARPVPPPPPPPPPPSAVPLVAPLTTFDQAQKQVVAFGFNVVRQDLWTRKEPLEVVIAQEPAPFSDAGPGTDVTLVVARLEDKRGAIILASQASQTIGASGNTPAPAPEPVP